MCAAWMTLKVSLYSFDVTMHSYVKLRNFAGSPWTYRCKVCNEGHIFAKHGYHRFYKQCKKGTMIVEFFRKISSNINCFQKHMLTFSPISVNMASMTPSHPFINAISLHTGQRCQLFFKSTHSQLQFKQSHVLFPIIIKYLSLTLYLILVSLSYRTI